MKSYFCIIWIFLLSSCYISEEVPTDQKVWPYAYPTEEQLRDNTLYSLDNSLENYNYGLFTGLVIVRNDKLVFENYYNFNRREDYLPIGTCTYMISVMIMDIFRNEGLITSLDQPIYELLPEYEDIFEATPLKKEITLQHLLDNRMGLVWSEYLLTSTTDSQDYYKMQSTNDYTRYVLEKSMEANPGTRYVHNTGGGMILMKIFQNLLIDESLEDFLKTELLDKMDITNYLWAADPQGILDGTIGLQLSAFDLAKFGYIIINEGRWVNQERLISRDWIFEITSAQTKTSTNYSSGYGWLNLDKDFMNAWFYNDVDSVLLSAGNHGQALYLLPDENMVISLTANNTISDELYNNALTIASIISYAIKNEED